MTVVDRPLAKASGVRVVFQHRGLRGPAYLCHANDQAHAERMAGRLVGQSDHAGGYDIYRLSDRAKEPPGSRSAAP